MIELALGPEGGEGEERRYQVGAPEETRATADAHNRTMRVPAIVRMTFAKA